MAKKRSWREMTSQQKAGVIFMAIIQITLAGIAYSDLKKRPASLVRGPKRLWYAVNAINFVGPITYLVFGRLNSPQV